MDVEHSVNTDDDADPTVAGCPMKLPTLRELKRYIDSTGLPFFMKGALMPAYDEQGPAGVARVIRSMNDQLKAMMLRTGSPDPRHIDPTVLHEAPWLR